jgi:hypothetical protein
LGYKARRRSLEKAGARLTRHRELDVLMLGCVFPQYCSVTAKKSLQWVPFLGWFSASLDFPTSFSRF